MQGGGTVKVCCGPRCGVEPNHRAIYAAVEQAAALAAPTMCRAHCGAGVTLVLPGGEIKKARDANDVRTQLNEPTIGGQT